MSFDIGLRVSMTRRRVRLAGGVLVLVVLVAVPAVVVHAYGGGTGPAAAPATSVGGLLAPGFPADESPAAALLSGSPLVGAALASLPAATRSTPPRVSTGTVQPAPLPLSPEPAAGSPAAVPAAPAGSPTPEFAAPARRMVLPAGAERVDEYPVKFPFSVEGAAAAAVATTRYAATLDYLTASEVLRLYAASANATQADTTASAAVGAARKRLGLPLAGPVSADASLVTNPVGVAWEVLAPDRVRIALESVAEYRRGDTITRELVSLNNFLRWDQTAGDWKLVPTPAGQFAGPPTAELGTQAFNDAGWSAIAQAQG